MNDSEKIRNTSMAKVSQLWTVVSMVDDELDCCIHQTEHDAYCDVVGRFESVELRPGEEAFDLIILLGMAGLSGNYENVQRYVREKAAKLSLIQVAEHAIS